MAKVATKELLKEYTREAARIDQERRAEKRMRPVEGVPFWPHEMIRNTIIVLFFTAIMFYLSAFMPYFLEAPADPRGQPAVILPDWYLLWSYGLLKIASDVTILGREISLPVFGLINAKTWGLLMNIVIMLPVLLAPFIDRGHSRRPVEAPFWAAGGIAGIIYVFMVSVYSIDVVVSKQWPILAKEFKLWTIFYFLDTNGLGGFFDWLSNVGIIRTPTDMTPDLSTFFTFFRFDLLSWLTNLLPVLGFFVAYIPLKLIQKKHGYEAKLNASYYKVR